MDNPESTGNIGHTRHRVKIEGLTIEILYLVKLNCHCSVLIEDIISLNMEWISNISYKMVINYKFRYSRRAR
jgi:hypothetical protein